MTTPVVGKPVAEKVSEDKILSVPMARLAMSAPREWDEFKAAFRKYSEAQRDLLVQSPIEGLQRIQGMALQCSQLMALFEDAVKAADRIAERAARKTT